MTDEEDSKKQNESKEERDSERKEALGRYNAELYAVPADDPRQQDSESSDESDEE